MDPVEPHREDLIRPRSRWRSLLVPREKLEAEVVELRRLWAEAAEELTSTVAQSLCAAPCPVCGEEIREHDVCLMAVVSAQWWQLGRMWKLWLAVRRGTWERCRALSGGGMDLGRDQLWVWVVACGEDAGVLIARVPTRGKPLVEVPFCELAVSRPGLEETLAQAGLAWGSLDDDNWSRQLHPRRR